VAVVRKIPCVVRGVTDHGERVYTVEGIGVKDPVANSGTGTDMRVTILNGIATQLTVV